MLTKFNKFWNAYGFEICVGLAVLFILIMALVRYGQQGTWSNTAYIPQQAKKVYEPRQQKSDSKGEVECRKVLENLFRKPFSKDRPDFLRNPVTGGDFNLELDCFNPQEKIAVEYNGVQHYKYIPYFHKNREAFMNQKYRDHMKREMCQKNGILLIEVPYTVKIPDIQNYLVTELKKHNRLPSV